MATDKTKTEAAQHANYPIKLGGFKIIVFLIILATGVGTLIFQGASVWAVAYTIILFGSVRFFHAKGWADFLREWYVRNFLGCIEIFYLNEQGHLVRRVIKCQRFSKPPFGTVEGEVIYLTFRLSGSVGSKKPHVVSYGAEGLCRQKFWEIERTETDNMWDWPNVYGEATKTAKGVLLEHPDGSRLHFSVDEALRVIKKLSIYRNSQVGIAAWLILLKGAKPFTSLDPPEWRRMRVVS